MERITECSICLNPFSSIKLPKSLSCGHSYCSDCIDDLIRSNRQTCPFCSRQILIESISINYALKDQVVFNEIFCMKHGDKEATHFSMKTLNAYCLECAANSSGLELIESSFADIGNLMLRKGFEIEHTQRDKLNDLTREKLARLSLVSNKEKIEVLKQVIQKIEGIKCKVHDREGVYVDLDSGSVLCDRCQGNNDKISLNSPTINDVLNHKIRKTAEVIDSITIPKDVKRLLPELQNLKTNEKVEVVTQLMQLAGKGRVSLINGLCDRCGQEFSFPGALPYRLPCAGAHFVCEICAKIRGSCPIDGNSFRFEALEKEKLRTPCCCVCREGLDRDSVPYVLACGGVTCERCIPSSCGLCGLNHILDGKKVSKYAIQLSEHVSLKCLYHNKPGTHFNPQNKSLSCPLCPPNPAAQSLSNFDLESYLVAECQRLAKQVGSRMTQSLINALTSISSSSNKHKLELFHLLNSLMSSSPTPSGSPGFLVPPYIGNFKYFQRFNSLLPTPNGPRGNTKPWYINRKENQVEVFAFVVSRRVSLMGVSITCPVDGAVGAIEFVDLYENDRKLVNCCKIKNICGTVEDILFESPKVLNPNVQYHLVFKVEADFVYKGNPLDRNRCQGIDGTVFEVLENKIKGIYTNGQSHISGPLIRIIYND